MSYIADNYKPTPTIQEFHNDNDSFFKCVLGPFGSSKSTAMCMEIIRRASEMPVFDVKENIRKSKWVIIRATYPSLLSTTLETWKKVLPPSVLNFKLGNREIPSCTIRLGLPDGTIMELILLFMALDNPMLVDRLASLEVTSGWLNECREIPYEIIQALSARIGRYPNKIKRNGNDIPFHFTIIADSNMPDEDNWIYRLAEIDKPKGYSFFKQPAALIKNKKTGKYEPNPIAENIENLPRGFGYYLNMIEGKSDAWINVYVCTKYGTLTYGKPVFPDFDENAHVAKEKLPLLRDYPVIVGVDYGFNAAHTYGQYTKFGQLRIIGELYVENITTREFIIDYVKPYIRNNFQGYKLEFCGDPASMTRSNIDGSTAYQEYLSQGINVQPCHTNSIAARIQAVTTFLTRRNGFLISPECHFLKKAMSGAYVYDRLKTSEERFSATPTKNASSHIADSCQYLCTNLDFQLTGNTNKPKIIRKSPIKWGI